MDAGYESVSITLPLACLGVSRSTGLGALWLVGVASYWLLWYCGLWVRCVYTHMSALQLTAKTFSIAQKYYTIKGAFYELRTWVIILLGRNLHFGTVNLRLGQMIIILFQWHVGNRELAFLHITYIFAAFVNYLIDLFSHSLFSYLIVVHAHWHIRDSLSDLITHTYFSNPYLRIGNWGDHVWAS
jgi:hypothetical protein